MFGIFKIKLKNPMTLDEFEQVMQERWNPEWGPYYRGRPPGIGSKEYMMFPLSEAYSVVADAKPNSTIMMWAAPMALGQLLNLADVGFVGSAFMRGQRAATPIKNQSQANKLTPVVRDKLKEALQPYLA